MYNIMYKYLYLQKCRENPGQASPHLRHGLPSSTSCVRTPCKERGRERAVKGGREEIREREGEREREREQGREGRREGERERGRKGEGERGRKEGREGKREEGREGRRDGERERGRKEERERWRREKIGLEHQMGQNSYKRPRRVTDIYNNYSTRNAL